MPGEDTENAVGLARQLPPRLHATGETLSRKLTGEGFFRIEVFVKASWRHANLTHDLGEAYFINTMLAKQLGS